MHKKDALKRKKLISQVRHHRVMPDGRVLTADGRETLLGNLAPVKHIPMLPWKRVITFPTAVTTITVSTTGKNAWFYNFLKAMSGKEHDLIGFTPVQTLDADEFENIGVGSVGMAAQVKNIEPTDDGKANILLKGICRYENIGLLPSTDDHFLINIRWFEDNREADSLVRPQYEKVLTIFERLSKAAGGEQMKEFFNLSKTVRYNYNAAQYLSFMFLESFGDWFTEKENCEMIISRSTANRLKKINDRSETELPDMEKHFRKIMRKPSEVKSKK